MNIALSKEQQSFLDKLEMENNQKQKEIERRCAEMAKISAERQESKVVQLPLWHLGKAGSPNSFLRSALFAAIQGKDRVYLENATLFSQQGCSVRFTGKQLNQEDMTVWVALVDLARQHPLGTECSFTAYGITKHMGLKDDGRQRQVLHGSIERLTNCTVKIDTARLEYAGHLIEEYKVDKDTRHYWITLNEKLIKLFGENDWTAISWEQRKRLRGKPLAQKLHEYYSSHMIPKPVTVEFLHKITGSNNSQLRDFKRRLKAALDELVKIAFLEGYSAEDDKVTVSRVHKAPSNRKYLGG
jgi:hypothetical protein